MRVKVVVMECRKGSAAEDTPLIYATSYKSLTDKQGFNIQILADSGCTKSLLPEWIARKNKIRVDAERAKEYSLKNASGENMVVKGTATIFVTPNGCRTRRAVECLVSSDLSESDLLLSWRDMKRPI